MQTRHIAAAVVLAFTSLGTRHACAAEPSAVRAGAAKVDVTPALTDLPKGYDGVYDHIYSRAIVVENGTSSVALITVDIGGMSSDISSHVAARVEKELGIPVDHILLTATHTHSVPRMSGAGFEDKIVQSVREAKAHLQPARIGYGTGVSYLNVNRDTIDPKTHRWWEGPNYDAPSDKTVAVMTISALNGSPLAVYYNYAMHGVTVGMLDQVSGDAPGATSRYIENSFDDKVVAVWSTGASGDQNPLYFQQTYDLRDIRIKDYAKRGEDISNAMPPGGQGLNKQDPEVKKLMNQQTQMILSLGQFLGEEVMHVMRDTDRTYTNVELAGERKVVTCPGRERTDTGRGGYPGTYKDGKPVDLQLSLIMIGDIAIAGVNGEVYNSIATRLKQQSRFHDTMMATLTNGMAPSGYIPDDASFGHNTFEVLSSHLQPGCAETKIVQGELDMMDALSAKSNR